MIRPLVTSIGESAGIGPDLAILLAHGALTGVAPALPPNVYVADREHLERRARLMGVSVPLHVLDRAGPIPPADDPLFGRALVVMPLLGSMNGEPGQPQEADAPAIIEAIKTGVDLVRKGEASGLVTLPINKKSLYDAGFDYPGHTEFLAVLAREKWALETTPRSVMMLAGPELRSVPVTIHIPLKDVPNALSSGLIEETARIVARDLKSRFGISRPRLAIAGLNPHAGENGALGTEDRDTIAPTVEALKVEGFDCFGPLPADTMFHAAARKTYDAALCMYHDQALIPAKALGFDDSVNVTLGLPFIRTSPDHGTAFDIAGTGKANPGSFVAALRMAADMAAKSS